MGLRDFVSFLNSKYIAPVTSHISTGEQLGEFAFGTADLERVPLEQLEKMYVECPPVYSGVNLFSESIFGKGCTVKSTDKRAKEHCTKVLNLPSFKPTLVTAVNHTLVYGCGFQGISWSKGGTGNNIVDFNIIDPKTIRQEGIKWDKHGRITKFIQKVNGEKKAEFPIFDEETEILEPNPKAAFYRFFRIGDSMWGLGALEPIATDVEVYMDMKQAVKEIVEKYANPPIHVIKKGAKSKKELEDAEAQFKGINRKSLILTSDNYSLKLIESGRAIPPLKSQNDMIIDSMVSGLRVPKAFLFGKGETGTWGATMNAFIAYSMFEIGLYQGKLTEIIQEQIFRPLCNKNNYHDIPTIVWNPLVEEDELQKIKGIGRQIDAIKKAKDAGLANDEQVQLLLVKLMDRWI